ncbi:rhomboid family intramembrane serine protease [Desulfopila sp. IMCC35008]|uniref:rhomboid family intramembrane serine protease n=1 Tax=Desulfopila sp. IMCC35008 TaxID=2653858 RepID=UPI0013D0EFBF|nr:rhomboid family intramembrane serine protease [Desulfopila sp. IMCC35008]
MLQSIRKKIQPTHLLYTTIALLAAVCNMHLLRGVAPSTFLYYTDNVLTGEWYRLLTHPLVHASWYHLLLDGLCMILLYRAARAAIWQKIAAVPICGITSLLYSIAQSPQIATTGYCGLSGIAHGFMFLVGWLWLFPTDRGQQSGWSSERWLGLLFCLVSLGKSLCEVYSGQILFADSHAGYLGGIPIVHAHLGGVFGGLLTGILIQAQRTFTRLYI